MTPKGRRHPPALVELTTGPRPVDEGTALAKSARDFKTLLARSSIGVALADVEQRGIKAHLASFDSRTREPRRHTRKSVPRK